MNNDIRFPEIKPLKIERYAKIVSTGVGLPERVVTNQDIIDEYDIIATDRAVRYSVGIVERRWVTDEKLEDLVAMAIPSVLKERVWILTVWTGLYIRGFWVTTRYRPLP